MKIHRVEQGTQEWHDLRRGKLTASHAQTIQANGKGLSTYVEQIVLKMLPSYDPMAQYISPEMERGNELEPVARAKYEFQTGNDVEEVGFIEVSNRCGCSPDGLVGDNGGIEIKCRNGSRHLQFLMGAELDKATWWQIQMNMWGSGRSWWDFVSYNPDFKDSIYIKRIEPDLNAFQKIRKGVYEGSKMIDDFLENDVIKKELGLK